MPVINCPKCQGKLRFPEDSPPRRVKCPTCGNTFLSSDGMPKPAADAAKSSRDRDEEDDDRPSKSRSRRSRDDEDDDRPSRSRARRDLEDDEDDRPSRSRRNRDDDDEDYDGRPSRRRRGDRTWDDDRPRRRDADPETIEGRFDRAGLACMLTFIGGWLHVAAMGMMVFIALLEWAGIREGLMVFAILAGLLGLGHWLTSAVGLGFLISGPRNHGALALSIATAATAFLHLVLLIVVSTSRDPGALAMRTADFSWGAFPTQAHRLATLLFFAVGYGGAGGGVAVGGGLLIAIFASLAEAARMILLLLALRAVMLNARDHSGARTCLKAVIGYAIGVGALLGVGLLFGLILTMLLSDGPKQDLIASVRAVGSLFILIVFLVITGLGVGTTLIIKSVKNRIDYRR